MDDVTRLLQRWRDGDPKALELDTRRLDADPSDRRAQFDVAIDLGGVGDAAWTLGRREEAAAAYERSLAMRERLADSDPQDVLSRSRVAYAHMRLVRFDLDLGRKADALAHARRAAAIGRALTDIDERHAELYAEDLEALGEAATSLNLRTQACAAYRESLKRAQAVQASSKPTATAEALVARIIGRVRDGLTACRPK